MIIRDRGPLDDAAYWGLTGEQRWHYYNRISTYHWERARRLVAAREARRLTVTLPKRSWLVLVVCVFLMIVGNFMRLFALLIRWWS